MKEVALSIDAFGFFVALGVRGLLSAIKRHIEETD